MLNDKDVDYEATVSTKLEIALCIFERQGSKDLEVRCCPLFSVDGKVPCWCAVSVCMLLELQAILLFRRKNQKFD